MNLLKQLENQAGIYFPAKKLLDDKTKQAIAMDADLATNANGGIPAWLLTYVDPNIIDVILSPMKCAEIFGEVKKGDWTTETAMFLTVEPTGETSSYGDYSNNGVSGVNVNFPQRQSYHYQTFTRWGEREVARAGEAKIDYVTQVNKASIMTLNRFQNKTYLYGVDGLENYGLLNDPALSAPIQSTQDWDTSQGEQVYEDIRKLFMKLVQQTGGNVDMNTPLLLVLSPENSVNLTKTNQFNVNVLDQLKKNFPNLRVETIPEYATQAGQVVQLIVEDLNGQKTVEMGFTEKLRAHQMEMRGSYIQQKKSQGTFGAIIYQPFAIAQMLTN